MAKRINIDSLLRDHTNYKSLLLEIYKQNKRFEAIFEHRILETSFYRTSFYCFRIILINR